MSNPKEIFKLEKVTDNPMFEGFDFKGNPPSLLGRDDLCEDLTQGYGVPKDVRLWEPTSLKDIWKTQKVVGRVAPFNDYPCLALTIPVFSKHACEELESFLTPNGELLPLESDIGEFYAFNVTKVADVLDVKNSNCDFWSDHPYSAVDISYYSFHESKLKGLSIFTIYEMSQAIYVTDTFKDYAECRGLNGFHFVKVWPFPKGVNFREYDKQKIKKHMSKDLKQNCVVVRLTLSKSKPSVTEKKQIKKLENELDALLKVTSLNTPYFGSYEEYDIANNEYRLFISGPDAKKLELKLLPWLNSIKWKKPVSAIKRYGNIHDIEAKEDPIVIKQLNK